MNLRQKLLVVLSAATAVVFLGLTLWLLLAPGTQPDAQLALPQSSFWDNPVDWTENLLKNNLPGHRFLTSMHTRFDVLMGQDKSDGVYIAGDALIEEIPQPESGQTASLTSSIREFALNCSSRVYFMAVPTRYEFLQSELSMYAPSWSQRVFSKDLAGSLQGYVTELDIYAELVDARDTGIWFNTETLWTSRGAYLGYRVFAEQLGLYPQEFSGFNLEIVSHDFEGALSRTLYGAAGTPDRIDLYYDPHTPDASAVERWTADGTVVTDSVYAREWLDTPQQDNVFLGEDCALTRVCSTVTNSRKLLVIGDGFADVMLPFFLRSYSQIDLVKLPLLDADTAEQLQTEDYNAVLLVYGVNSLVSTGALDNLSLLYAQ